VRNSEIKVLTGCIIGPFIIAAWVSVCCLIMYFVLSKIGILRVTPEVEDRGLDEV